MSKITVITIISQPYFEERIELTDALSLRVSAKLLEESDKTVFEYAADSAAEIEQLIESFALLTQKFAAREPTHKWTGSWYKFEREKQSSLVARDHQIELSANLRQALFKLDMTAGLTVRSVESWLDVSQKELASGNYDRAFAAAQAAYERLSLPHVRIQKIKDDTSLKMKAAKSTFAAGRKNEAVEMATSLARAKLQALRVNTNKF